MRPAQPTDAPVVLELMYTAIGDIAHTLTGTTNKEQSLLALRSFLNKQVIGSVMKMYLSKNVITK